jgi:hypothetical protein
MSSLKQTEANRLNAQKSTGPRTTAGRAVSRFNALKSGIDAQAEIIPGEDPAKLEGLLAEYQARFDTSTPERRMLVDILVNCEWMLRRLRRGESEFWKYKAEDRSERPHIEGRILDWGDKVYDRLQRRINAIQRNYRAALKELEALPPAVDEPESVQQPAPGIGFVLEHAAYEVGQALPPALPAQETPRQPFPGGLSRSATPAPIFGGCLFKTPTA